MKIATFKYRGRQHVTAIFGIGLIGSAIVAHLKNRTACQLHDLTFNWRDRSVRDNDAEAIATYLEKTVTPDANVDFVWSAGRAGFSAPAETFEEEHQAFETALEICNRIGENRDRFVRFHLFSSAGGLFEGRRNVRATDSPAPLRPYGRAKLQQESALSTAGDQFTPIIYRPSSVYGFTRFSDRLGLVTALLKAAYRRQPVKIFGRPAGLRDFILNDDIGRFVVSNILNPDCTEKIHHLVSGVPSSIMHIIREVEFTTRLPTPLHYVCGADNASDNTFHPSIKPDGLETASLSVGIGIVSRKMYAASIQTAATAP